MSEETETKTTPPEAAAKDNLVVSQHTLTLNGQALNYTVTCGTLVLKEESEGEGDKAGQTRGEQPKAAIFFVAYTLDDVADRRKRPLTFSFNGGPGSSSVWLHLGLLGPRRVAMGDAGALLPPPWGLEDNPSTLLDQTDLVFIDPVSTGFSRAVPGEKPRQFHGFTRDIQVVGDFIRLYCSRSLRWESPKYLIGESYGTTRAAGLSGYLQERHGLYLNGIMLISAVLNFMTVEFDHGNDLPYPLHLPTYAATAWYHQALAADLQAKPLRQVLDEVERFAMGEYNQALMQGARLKPAERAKIVKTLARYTGLSADYIERTNLRVEIMRFCKELLRGRRRTVGRLDTRFIGIDRDAAGEHFEADPSYSAIMGPYSAAFNQYVRAELKFESDLPYEILNMKVWPWSYAEHENKYVDVAETLRQAIAANPAMKILIANGYFDLATPYFATEYIINHLALDAELRANIALTYYDAGHMMYVHMPSLEHLKQDLAAFLA